MLKRILWLAVVAALLFLTFGAGWITGRIGLGSTIDEASLPDLERQFSERMRGATLVGRFTIAGREDAPPRPDRYDIASVEKVGDDRWRFNARIRYGDVDVTLPVTVPMRWAGDTPVVTLTDVAIPSLGTFTAHVLFSGDRYAGTWQHGDTGGHLFGRIDSPAREP